MLNSFFKKKKEDIRRDLDYLGEIAGHKWYKPSSIDDTITDRYLDYLNLSKQFDALNIRFEDLQTALYGIQEALRNNKTSLAAELNTALIGYIELMTTNDAVFSIVNCFLIIDDEPINKLDPNFTKQKKELYDKHDDVKVFFCELWNILRNQTNDSIESTNTYNFLKSRISKVSESVYFRSLKMAKDLR